MDKMILLFVLMGVHLIGAIISIIVDYKIGVFKEAAENGDGIRTAKPFDVFILDLLVWEVLLFMDIFCFVEDIINYLFNKKYDIE